MRQADLAQQEDEWPLTKRQEAELASFLEALKDESALQDSTVLLFGSAARGRAYPFSDLDVAVVAEFFKGKPWSQRLDILAKGSTRGSPITAIGVTPEELSNAQMTYPSVLRNLAPDRPQKVLLGRPRPL
jgi:predicted nucleotidyltransferase